MPMSRILPVVVGIFAHLVVFIRGEYHLRVPTVILSHLALVVATWAFLRFQESDAWLMGLPKVFGLLCYYLAGLFGSITIYRVFFHRLRHFPGPPLAAVTKLWHVYQCRDSKNHLVLDSLHKKYGNFVRTGPGEITIFTPAAFESMDGAGNKNTRSDWYDIVHPRISPIFSRDEKSHIDRRQVWTRALSSRSIMEYLPRILRQISTLEQLIAASDTKPILVNDIMQWFAFDSMGEFAFNQNFGMMASGEWHKAIKQQRSALSILGSCNPAMWSIRLAFACLPFFSRVKDWNGMMTFCDSCMGKRLNGKAEEPDIAAHFIKEMNKNTSHDAATKKNLLSGNAVSVIVGGSDTTGPSLILLWYFLAKYPEHAEIIHQEVSTIDPHDINTLATLPHLNGVINEAMRLLPAALSMGTRVTPPEGLDIEGTFIPGNTKIAAPRYTIFRLESAYEDPLSFIPERWSTRPELIKDKRAFQPFGVGRRACVGKNLALTQIRLVAAILLTKYRVRFAPGEDGEAVVRDMRDQLTAQPGKYHVIFEARA